MPNEIELVSLRARVSELENMVRFLYEKLNIEYVAGTSQIALPARVIDAIKKGDKVEAIRIYRELYPSGLVEAKTAIDNAWPQYHH